jgi:heptosyltransferase-2|tara:strand:+ start:4989 stop:5963 length:975 start_codon:yes stop_codon:yes gene_type:complete
MKILVIQSKMGIGDTIIYLPYIEAISRQYNSKVTLLAKKNSKASELRESCEYIENIIYLERDNKEKNLRHNGFFGSINLINDLKKHKFDYVFIFNSSIRYKIISKLSGIKHIFQYPLFKKKNQNITVAAQKLIFSAFKENIKSDPILKINHEKVDAAKNEYNIEINKINILLGTGGSGINKIISSKIYIDFILKCINKYDCKFFIATGKSEEENKVLNEILNSINKCNFVKLNDLTIKETLPIIKNCNVAICNDTSFSHISAALGLETIVLIADTSILYGSYSSKMHPITSEETKSHLQPRQNIDPDKIFNKFEKILTKLKSLE